MMMMMMSPLFRCIFALLRIFTNFARYKYKYKWEFVERDLQIVKGL